MLSNLAIKHGTDKVSHGFTKIYDDAMKYMSKRAQKVLEVGVFFGASIKMWREYFENATIYGLDTFEGKQGNGTSFPCPTAYWDEQIKNPNPKIKLYKVNQGIDEQLKDFCNSQLAGTFDVIIDDGSHIMRDQQQTFAILFPLLRPGGIYVIEDLHCCTVPGEYGVKSDFSNSTLNILENFTKMSSWTSPYSTSEEKAFLENNVGSIKIFTATSNGVSKTSIIRRRILPRYINLTENKKNLRPRVAIINYATDSHLSYQIINTKWAYEWGADAVISFCLDDLDEEFKKENESILKEKRGGGYWLWKPYISQAVFHACSNIDLIIYCDSGSNIKLSKSEWLAKTNDHELQIVDIPDCLEECWTKQELLLTLDADNKNITETPQIAATIFGMRKGSTLVYSILQRWLVLACQYRLITDTSSKVFPCSPKFREHRHDQSIFSLICKLKNIKPFSAIQVAANHHTSDWTVTKYFSQCGQDKRVNELFFKDKTNGFYVDVGAHDGINLSNTYHFELRGWKGILFEPNPLIFKDLQKNRKGLCLNTCAYNKSGSIKFNIANGPSNMLSGIDERHKERIKHEIKTLGGKLEVVEAECVTLESVFDKNNVKHVDYLTIDTKGSELQVLQGINFDKVTIDVIDLEDNYPGTDSSKEMIFYLLSKGYGLVERIGRDIIFKRIK